MKTTQKKQRIRVVLATTAAVIVASLVNLFITGSVNLVTPIGAAIVAVIISFRYIQITSEEA